LGLLVQEKKAPKDINKLKKNLTKTTKKTTTTQQRRENKIEQKK
jgi:hypothetical protein